MTHPYTMSPTHTPNHTHTPHHQHNKLSTHQVKQVTHPHNQATLTTKPPSQPSHPHIESPTHQVTKSPSHLPTHQVTHPTTFRQGVTTTLLLPDNHTSCTLESKLFWNPYKPPTDPHPVPSYVPEN